MVQLGPRFLRQRVLRSGWGLNAAASFCHQLTRKLTSERTDSDQVRASHWL